MNSGAIRRVTPQLILGLGLAVLGLVLTLDNFDVIESEQVLRYWPVILIAFGVARIVSSFALSALVPGLLFILGGGWLLLWNLGRVHVSLWQLWPVALVLLGLSILHRAFSGPRGPAPELSTVSETSAFAMMSGVERRVSSTDFRRADATAIMGGVEIELRGAEIAGDRAVVDVFALWGGVELVVPVGWTIDSRVQPIMGAFEDKTLHPLPGEGPAKVLELRGWAIMGGVEVRNRRSKED